MWPPKQVNVTYGFTPALLNIAERVCIIIERIQLKGDAQLDEQIKTNEKLDTIIDRLDTIIDRCLDCKDPAEEIRVIFSKIRVNGILVEGEINKVKAEIGQFVDVVATPVGGNGFQSGTEQWSVSARNEAGEDVSSQIVQSSTPGQESNPLAQRFQHDGGAECVASVVFRADGDRDVDETAEIVGTLDIVFDEKNVTAVELSGTAGNPEATPEG